jgi:oligopeptide/dipeptide ABC transporter ATP-binding protein
MCDRIVVMYAGKIAELADCERIYEAPAHPYTEALLSAAVLGKWLGSSQEIILEGDPPSRDDPPPGCRFHTRCPYVMPICREVEPQLLPTEADHLAACHLLTDGNGRANPDRQPEDAASSVPSGEPVA